MSASFSVEKTSNISFDFKEAASQSYQDYPRLKYSATFYDVGEQKIYADNLVTRQLTRSLWKTGKNRTASAVAFGGHGKSKVMFYAPGKTSFFSACETFTFDHELGHLLTSSEDLDALDMRRKESIADAFALIRRFQRYGSNADDVADLTVFRSLEAIIKGSSSHFTSLVTAQILKDRDIVDFLTLSPEETWQMAYDYAQKYAPDFKDARAILDEITRDFRNLKPPTLVEALSTTCLSSNNPQSFFVAASTVMQLVKQESPEAILSKFRITEAPDDPILLKAYDAIEKRAEELGVAPLLKAFKKNAEDITAKALPNVPCVNSRVQNASSAKPREPQASAAP